MKLPEPAGWQAASTRIAALSTVLLGAGAFALFFAATAGLQGRYGPTFAWLAMSAMTVTWAVALVLVHAGRTSPRLEQSSEGMTLRADRRFGVLVLTGALVGIVAILTFSLLIARGELDTTMPRTLQIGWMVGAAIAVLAVAVASFRAWRRGGIGWVRLTGERIDIANMTSTESILWGDVRDVTGHSETQKATRRAIVLSTSEAGETVLDGADFYYPAGASLFWMVRHYWKHPEDRPELADGRAADRLRDGRFDVS